MADRTRLTASDVRQLAARYPGLPVDYLNYMHEVGWGEAPSGHMIYSGPISPREVYPQVGEDRRRVLIGDDMQGYGLGYDFELRQYGEFSDSGEWSGFDERFDLAAYLAGSAP